MSAVPTLPIADPAAASAGPAKSRASRLQISPRSRDGMRVFMGYHGIIWGSMGMDSKTLEYPGVAEVFTSPWGVFGTKRDRIACPARANAMLTRQWGEMMFFFCSHHREDRAELGPKRRSGGEECQAAYKPGSVPAPCGAMDDHSSGTSVAGRLTRPTRAAAAETRLAGTGPEGPAGRPPLCGLAPGGVYHAAAVAGSAVRSYRTLSPLPAAAFNGGRRRSALCGTFPGVAPAGRYPAPCFRGARTFLPSAPKGRRAAIQPSGGC